MANLEHLEILKQGVEAWDKWRKENTEIVPNLGGANLSGTDLSGAQLYLTNLRRANLIGADLRGAKNLSASQVKEALNWQKAFYSDGLLMELGLPADHNEKLQAELDEQRESEE